MLKKLWLSAIKEKTSFFISEILYALCQFSIFFSTLYIVGVSEAGGIAYVMSIITPIFLLSNMQLKMVCGIDRVTQHTTYLAIRILTVIISFVFIMALMAILFELKKIELLAVAFILPLIFIKSIDSVHDIFGAFHLKDQRLHVILRAGVIKFFGYCLIYPLALYLFSVLNSLNILGIYLFVSLFILEFPLIKKLWRVKKWERNSSSIVLRSLPLGFASAADSLGVNVLRYLLGTAVGLGGLATFNLVYQLMLIPQIFLSMLTRYFSHIISKNKNDSKNGKTIILLYIVSLVLGIGFVTMLNFEFVISGLKKLSKDIDLNINEYIIILGFSAIPWYFSGVSSMKLMLRGRNKHIFSSILLSSAVILIVFEFALQSVSPEKSAAIALLVGFSVRAVYMEGQVYY